MMKLAPRIFHCSLLIFHLMLVWTTANAAQTINSDIPNNTPDSRYTDHNNGTVTDTVTGLMWKQCAEGLSGSDCGTGSVTMHTWQAALILAEQATDAGYTDWRVPNIKELNSLVALDRYGPSINSTLFPNTPSDWFLSSSPSADNSARAWHVTFAGGRDSLGGRGSGGDRVRLVRSGGQ